jgi:hypothetical protein
VGTFLRRFLFTWLLAAASAPLHADFHLWVIDEAFSNADGTVQYVELRALTGGQQFLAGHAITSGTGPSVRTYTFPSNLPGDTTGKSMLIGTASFAALGLIAPDYVVPDNVLDVPSGTLNFAGVDTWLFDLSVCLNDWAVDLPTGRHDPARAAAFVAAYAAVRPLSAAERQLLPAMLRAGALRFWISRLWDFHLPREASLLKPHDPTHFERVLRERVAHPVTAASL